MFYQFPASAATIISPAPPPTIHSQQSGTRVHNKYQICHTHNPCKTVETFSLFSKTLIHICVQNKSPQECVDLRGGNNEQLHLFKIGQWLEL